MTFDEAIKYAKENSFVEEMLSNVVELEDVIDILEKLKKEYAPTIEMTKIEKDTLLEYIFGDEGNFFDLVEYETDYSYRKLSTSELMQAWLHPETIKIVGDEND